MQTMEIDFTRTEDASSDPENITMERVVFALTAALKKRFPGDYERQRVIGRLNGERLNFSCPYCGDSADSRKRRGNFYTNTLTYKCYNGGCEMHVNLLKFMKDFDVSDTLTDGEKTAARAITSKFMEEAKNSRMLRQDLSLDMLVSADFQKMLIPRKKLVEDLGLLEMKSGTFIHNYLYKRAQATDKKFLWDPKKSRLFILNLDRTGEFVFALQTRQFGRNEIGAKYLTYPISSIWSKLLGCKDQTFLDETSKLNTISTVFGCLKLNFNDPVTVFEGPLDSFLYPNSCGMCSVHNDWPFDVEGYRWFQDNDDAGRKRAMRELEKGKPVFMWKKFMDDYSLHGKKIKDLNDIIVYEQANKMTFGDLERFFSSHKLDGIFV